MKLRIFMPRKQLQVFDMGKIVAYHEHGMSNREIAKLIGRSESTIRRVLKKWKETRSIERKKGSEERD